MQSEDQIKKDLNILRYKCDDMEIAPFIAKALEIINRGYPCPNYEELKQLIKKESEVNNA